MSRRLLVALPAAGALLMIFPLVWTVVTSITAGGDVLTWKDGRWQAFERFEPTRPARGKGEPRLRHWGRPLLMGALHGLAGSAALLLLVLATMPSTLAALLYEDMRTVQGGEAVTPAVDGTVGAIQRAPKPDVRHFVWLSLGPNATLPDVIAAALRGMHVGVDGFFFLTPEQQIAFLVQVLRRPREGAFVVLDQFEELLNAETTEGLPGRGAIERFFETLRDADIGASRLLLTSYRSPNSMQNAQVAEQVVHLRSYFVSRVSIPEGIALLQQRGVQGSHSELSLVWQRCGGHVFALILFSILTSLSGFSLSYLLNSPDYAPMWNGEVTRNLIVTLYYYLNPVQRTLMRALCLFAEPVPLDAIATAIMGEHEAGDGHKSAYNGSPYMAFQRELSALVEMCLVQEQSKGIGQHHLLPNHFRETEGLKLVLPAVDGDQRPVRSKQHLVLKHGSGVPNERIGKVFWRPTTQIDVNVALVHRNRQQFLGPRPARVSADDFEPREIGGHVVHVERARVLEFQSHAARRAGADPGCSHVEEADQTQSLGRLIDGIEALLAWKEALHCLLELETD